MKADFKSDLPTLTALDGKTYPLGRTTSLPLETPINTTFQTLSDTYETLNNLRKIETHLRRLNLYNSKYLILRNKKYYFILDLIKKTGAYFSTFSYNSPNNNQLNSASNFYSNHNVN